MKLFGMIAFVGLLSSPVVLAQSKPMFLDLPYQQVSTLPNRQFYVDSLFDNRSDTTRIGTFQKASGKSVDLALKGGFLPCLRSFLFMTYSNIDRRYRPVTVAIDEFELTNGGDKGRFELALTFFERDSLGKLQPVYKAEIVNEGGTHLPDRMHSGLASAFTHFNGYLLDPVNQPPLYSDFDLEMAKAAKELNLQANHYNDVLTIEDNLLTCPNRRLGIYQDFDDLQRNRPALTGSLQFHVKNDFATLHKPSGTKAKYRFFGFSVGNDLYLNTGLYNNSWIRRYVKVRSVGRYLLWIDDYVTMAETAARATGVQFGLIGAALASATASYRDCIALDMKSGAVFMVTKEKLEEILSAAPALWQEYEALPNKKDESRQLDLLHRFNQLKTSPENAQESK